MVGLPPPMDGRTDPTHSCGALPWESHVTQVECDTVDGHIVASKNTFFGIVWGLFGGRFGCVCGVFFFTAR